MSNLKEDNKAEYNMTVGSLTVLHSVDGPGMTTIKRQIEALQNSISSVSEKTLEYWRDISSDNVITPGEKSSIKKEFNLLTQQYTSIIQMAEEKHYEEAVEIEDLKTAYKDLYDYIYTTLKLFDDMKANTEIPDANVFNSYFSVYYDKEFKAQNIFSGGFQRFEFAAGTKDTYPTDDDEWYDAPPTIPEGSFLWMRTAFETAAGERANWTYSRIQGEEGPEGPEGERGPQVKAKYSMDGETEWHDEFDAVNDRFMKLSYDDGVSYTAPMKIVGEDGQGAYAGLVYTAGEMPDPKDGNFFVSANNFTADSIITVNGNNLLLNGKLLVVKKTYEFGIIYFAKNKTWIKVTDTNNYRYVIAVNDLKKIGAPLSPNLQSILEETATDIATGIAGEVATNIVNKVVDDKVAAAYMGTNLGLSASYNPRGAKKKDWYTYIGNTSVNPDRKKTYIYVCNKDNPTVSDWQELSQNDVSNYDKYMAELPALLDYQKDSLEPGYFSTVFAEALMANSAFIKQLATSFFELWNDAGTGAAGIIKSKEYSTTAGSRKGFLLDTDGNANFMGNLNIGGTTNISGKAIIEGITDIKSTLNVTGTTNISGNVTIGGNATLEGKVKSKNYDIFNRTGFNLDEKFANIQAMKVSDISPWDEGGEWDDRSFVSIKRAKLAACCRKENPISYAAAYSSTSNFTRNEKLEIMADIRNNWGKNAGGSNGIDRGTYNCVGRFYAATQGSQYVTTYNFNPCYVYFYVSNGGISPFYVEMRFIDNVANEYTFILYDGDLYLSVEDAMSGVNALEFKTFILKVL